MARIKVVPRSLTEAYKRREGDFSPNLVGLQFTDPNAYFTLGNFQITTNLASRVVKDFVLGGEWSDYYNLNNLDLSEEESAVILSNQIFVKLNFNPNKIERYVYFGSFYEYARVTLEETIQKWKGALYLNPTLNSNVPLNTVLSFSFDSGENTSTFLIPKSVANNPFELIVDIDYTPPPVGEIYNLNFSFNKYVINSKGSNYKVIGYTGSTTSNPYIKVKTQGNPFPTLTASTFGGFTYLLKPNDTEVELFFQDLNDFQRVLLNRLTTPIYTAKFDVPEESDGVSFTSTKIISWPVSDGYNIDINTRDYALYVESLLDIASTFDANKTDLVSRRFVSESIHEFDTNGGGDELYGMKVTKLLKIYGREFDEVKKYIDGISFANVVTYDKLDNTSDELIKVIAKNLGFDVLLTVTTNDFDLKQQILTTPTTPFSGYSRSLSAKELDIELWRRLVINAWWLYKSKGTRKVIEFLLNLFKIPECMISLDEYVYLANERLETTSVFLELEKIYGNLATVDLNTIPMDDFGFPLPLPETTDNYFQNDGFWYNNGNDVTTGNNPHYGPYDDGIKYFEQFKCFVPNFNDFLTGLTTVFEIKNSFTEYDKGNFTVGSLPQYPNATIVTNATLLEAGGVSFGDIEAPNTPLSSEDLDSLKIKFKPGDGSEESCKNCNYDLSFSGNGLVYITGTANVLNDEKCCQHFIAPNGNCYWCAQATTEVCTPEEYLDLFSNSQIEAYATTLGWSPSSNIPINTFVIDLITPIFTQNGCLIMDKTDSTNPRTIKNSECCTLKGGSLVEYEGSYFCAKAKEDPCVGYTVENHVYVIGDELLSEECCVLLGFNWNGNLVNPSEINVYDSQGRPTSTFTDNVGLGYATTFGNVKAYCSACPQNIIEQADGLYAYFPNGENPPQPLSQNCCIDYGFSYNSTTGKCSKCPTPTISSTFEIVFPSTTDLEDCCVAYGGYYYDAGTTNNGSGGTSGVLDENTLN